MKSLLRLPHARTGPEPGKEPNGSDRQSSHAAQQRVGRLQLPTCSGPSSQALVLGGPPACLACNAGSRGSPALGSLLRLTGLVQ